MALDNPRGSPAGDVQASPAALTLLGAETLGRLRGEAFRRYDCCQCGRPGRTDADPAAVIVHRYRLNSIRVRLAHARCADSQIVEVDADMPDVTIMGGMLAKSAVLEYASEPRVRPLLILEPTTEPSERSAGGEQRNLWMSGLLERGFTLVLTGGEFPRPAGGWLVQVAPHTVRLLAPDGSVGYEGGLAQSQQWRDLIRRAHACVVLIGTIGLYVYPDDEMSTQDLRRLLNQAACGGDLAGAVVTTTDL